MPYTVISILLYSSSLNNTATHQQIGEVKVGVMKTKKISIGKHLLLMLHWFAIQKALLLRPQQGKPAKEAMDCGDAGSNVRQ